MALILLDVLANSLCIAMMLRITGRRVNPLRMTAAALLGALAAQGVRLGGFGPIQQALFWLPIATGMALAAEGCIRVRAPLVLIACTGFLGGTVQAISGALGSLRGAWCAGIGFALILSANLLRARRAAQDVRTVCIRISHGGYEAELEALVDSGNCLRDYLTGRPVIVLPEAMRAPLGLEGAPLRPIFADTAGGRQMMACFTPQNVTALEGGRAVPVAACIAFSPGMPPGAPALLPQSLMTKQTNWDESRSDREGNAYGEAEG